MCTFSVLFQLCLYEYGLLCYCCHQMQSAGACTGDVPGHWSGSAGPDTHLCSTSSKHQHQHYANMFFLLCLNCSITDTKMHAQQMRMWLRWSVACLSCFLISDSLSMTHINCFASFCEGDLKHQRCFVWFLFISVYHSLAFNLENDLWSCDLSPETLKL